MHGQFVWYDLMTSDSTAAQRFYTSLFGWKTQPFEGPSDNPYTMWMVGREAIGGVSNISRDQSAIGVRPNWMPSVEVTNVDESTQKTTSLGGKVVVGPMPIPGMGRFAVIKDPQGASIAIYEADDPAEGFDGHPSVGRMSWNELMTTDDQRAFEFYRQLFGWEKIGEFDMGPGSKYVEFGQNGKMYGGIYNRDAAQMPNMPPNWLPYVYVKDIDKSVDAAKKAGGMLGRGPMDIPGGGRIAILADPQGARFALHQGAAVERAPARKKAKAKTKSKRKVAARPKVKTKKKASRPKAKAKTRRATPSRRARRPSRRR